MPRDPLDEDQVGFYMVHFNVNAPGLGHIVECGDDGMIFSMWGHLFVTPWTADHPELRPLGRFARLFAPETFGEFVLRRLAHRHNVPAIPQPAPRQWLLRFWLRHTRMILPALDLLGGRIQPPALRKIKALGLYWLSRWGAVPLRSGFLDHGILIDRICTVLHFQYAGKNRSLWLNQIRLHSNHSLHLVGIDLDKQQQRTFRLDRMTDIHLQDAQWDRSEELYWSLHVLVLSRRSWIWSWNQRCKNLGHPPAPPLDWIGVCLVLGLAILHSPWQVPGVVRLGWRWVKDRARALYWYRRRLTARLQWRWQEYQAARHPPALPRLQPDCTGDPAWRRRLLRAIQRAEAGENEQISCLLPLQALFDTPSTARAFLRYLLHLAWRDVCETSAAPVPQTAALLAMALAVSPETRQIIPEQERKAAYDLWMQIYALQPGYRRISIHATRRAGTDARLLMAEHVLAALYGLTKGKQPCGSLSVNQGVCWYDVYMAMAYFIVRWDRQRFRIDVSSLPRLRSILAWCDALFDPH